jgi:hypothetical protein
MTRHFSLRKMLANTPKCLLREFFDKIGHQPLALDWNRLPGRKPEPLMRAISLMDPVVQAHIETELARVFELACTSGIQTYLEASRNAGFSGTPPGFPTNVTAYHQAMWAWLHYPEIADRATTMQQVDNLTRWRHRNGIPRVEPRTTPQSLLDFGEGLSNFLRQYDGRGDRCTVKHFRREDGIDYFVANPDDYWQELSSHDSQGKFVSRQGRLTFEIVFAYHREEGTLGLNAPKIASDLKPKLEQLFGEIVLGEELTSCQNDAPYDLNRLRDRCFVLDTDPEDRVVFQLSSVRLGAKRRGRVTLDLVQDGVHRDIYDMADDWLHPQKVSWQEVNITMATFRLQLLPKPGRRARTLEVVVTFPDGCRVNSRDPRIIELIRKYLKRWRILRV